jgi:hypothetical protein
MIQETGTENKLADAKEELRADITCMYRLRERESIVIDRMLNHMDKEELKLLCKIVRVANKVIFYE